MPRARWTAVGLASLLAMAALAAVVAAEAGTPKDGQAGPVAGLGTILQKKLGKGTMVTTEWVKVVKLDCPSCFSASHTAMGFWVEDDQGRKVRTWWAKYPEFNAKKQNWVPKVGWMVKVQGRVDYSESGTPYIDGKRWGEGQHPGPTVSVDDITSGKVANGAYVWLEPVKLRNKAQRPDGDVTYDAFDAKTGRGRVHLELSLPFNTAGLREPSNGEVVRPYGMVWRDYALGWWELHPVRCWKPGECAPAAASFVDNDP